MSEDLSQKFLSNPDEFLSKVPVSCAFLQSASPVSQYRIWAPTNDKAACVIPAVPNCTFPNGINAELVPFIKNVPQHINVSMTAPTRRYIFTAALSGCSIYVTNCGNGTINVWHDPRSAPLFSQGNVYDQDNFAVIADFNYNRYRQSDLASAFMVFQNGHWYLYGQVLSPPGAGQTSSPLPFPTPYQSTMELAFYGGRNLYAVII